MNFGMCLSELPKIVMSLRGTIVLRIFEGQRMQHEILDSRVQELGFRVGFRDIGFGVRLGNCSSRYRARLYSRQTLNPKP